MSLVPSLLQAIVKADGEAMVMHAGDKPYVVSPTGQVELASRGLTLEAVNGIVGQLLPAAIQNALEEFGAIQYELPALPEFPSEHFTVVAARGGDDVWVEIRRRRAPDEDRVPEDMFPAAAGPAAVPVVAATAAPPPPPPAAVAAPSPAVSAPVAAVAAARGPQLDAVAAHAATPMMSVAPEPVHQQPPANAAVVGAPQGGVPDEGEEINLDDDLSLPDETHLFGAPVTPFTDAELAEGQEHEIDLDEADVDVAASVPEPVRVVEREIAQPAAQVAPPPVPALAATVESFAEPIAQAPDAVAEAAAFVAAPVISDAAMLEPDAVEAIAPEPEWIAALKPELLVPEPVVPELLMPEPVVPELLMPEPLVPEPLVPEPVVPELLMRELAPESVVADLVSELLVPDQVAPHSEATLESAAPVELVAGAETEPAAAPQPEMIAPPQLELTSPAFDVFGAPGPEMIAADEPQLVAPPQPGVMAWPELEAVSPSVPVERVFPPADHAVVSPEVELISAFGGAPEIDLIASLEAEAIAPAEPQLPGAVPADAPFVEAVAATFWATHADAPMPLVAEVIADAQPELIAGIEVPQPQTIAEITAPVEAAVPPQAEPMGMPAFEPTAMPESELVVTPLAVAAPFTVEEPPPIATVEAPLQTAPIAVAAPQPRAVPPAGPTRASAHVDEPDEIRTPPAPQAAVVLQISRSPIRGDQPTPAPSEATMPGLDRLLRMASARGASTLYLSSDSQPSMRVDGELHAIDAEPVHTSRDVESLLLTLMPERNHEALRSGAQTEWICDIDGVGRVRCMSFRDHRGPGGVFRLMPTRTVSVEQLGVSRHVQSLATEPSGLVLIAGPRSSGKRTLMAAFVDLMNRTRRDHIITIEREINIVQEGGHSFISQREVRGDDDEMVAAARSALREDPDVLVIEDLRTAPLMNVALEAAAAGRLVVAGSSAHTAGGAIDRIIDLYAPEERRHVQMAIADSLRGVVVQVLLRKVGGGRLPAREVLLNTPAVSSVIAEGKTSQLPMAIEGGRRYGMVPLNDALVGLVQSGAVEAREAYRHSPDRPGFLASLARNGLDTSFVERLA